MEYQSKPTLTSGIMNYRVTDSAIIMRSEKKNEETIIPYYTIDTIRITNFEGQGICKITTKDNKKHSISSRFMQGIGKFEDRIEEYKNFVVQFHDNLRKANQSVKYYAGSDTVFFIGVSIIGLVVFFFILGLSIGLQLRIMTKLLLLTAIAVPLLKGKAQQYQPGSIPDKHFIK